jgi:hypothetical protein
MTRVQEQIDQKRAEVIALQEKYSEALNSGDTSPERMAELTVFYGHLDELAKLYRERDQANRQAEA